MVAQHLQRSNGYRELAVASTAVAATALGGAVGLVTGVLSIGARLEHRLPFHSPVLGGIALALWVAVPFGLVAGRAWRADRRSGLDSMMAGVALLAWLAVELAFIREVSFFHPLYAVIGVAFVVSGWALSRRLRTGSEPTITDRDAIDRFLAQNRIALVGASADPRKFSHTVLRALIDHGYDVVPVNPTATQIDGIDCHRSVTEVACRVDGVMVMLTGPAALSCVEECISSGVKRVWLFRGAGAPGAMSVEAVDALRRAGTDVVAGACPLMFLEPVARFHRMHLAIRRLDGSLVGAS